MVHIDIVFLGTSAGVPSKYRGLPSIAVRAGEWMLFDCGEGSQREMMKRGIPYGSISRIFLTHMHLDHILGVFGLSETFSLLLPYRKLFVYSVEKFIDKPNVKNSVLSSGVVYENRDFKIQAFPTKHVVKSFGFSIIEKDRRKFYPDKANKAGIKGKMFSEILSKGSIDVGGRTVHLDDISWIRKGRKVCYTGDTVPCKSVVDACKGADILIHESTFLDKDREKAEESGHSTAVDAARIAKKCGAKRLILTHISARYSDASEILDEARGVFPNTEIAYDGFVVRL